jgi:hypothetical protein
VTRRYDCAERFSHVDEALLDNPAPDSPGSYEEIEQPFGVAVADHAL